MVVGGVVAARLGVGVGGVLGQGRAGDGVQVARHAVHAHQVGPVGRDLQLEHLVGDRQVLGQRLAHGHVAVEHHDPEVVLADADLVLGQDHPARLDPAQLRLAQRRAIRHDRARQRHRHGLTGGHVGGAADDRLRVAAADVDLADAEPVGVGVLLGLEHAAGDERGHVPHADAVQPLELVARQREPVGHLRGAEPGVAVGAQPGERDPHAPAPNWSSRRRSLSNSIRRSGTW